MSIQQHISKIHSLSQQQKLNQNSHNTIQLVQVIQHTKLSYKNI